MHFLLRGVIIGILFLLSSRLARNQKEPLRTAPRPRAGMSVSVSPNSEFKMFSTVSSPLRPQSTLQLHPPRPPLSTHREGTVRTYRTVHDTRSLAHAPGPVLRLYLLFPAGVSLSQKTPREPCVSLSLSLSLSLSVMQELSFSFHVSEPRVPRHRARPDNRCSC